MLRTVLKTTAIRPVISRSVIGTQTRGYHENVLDHYESPRNVRIPLEVTSIIKNLIHVVAA